MLILFGVWQKLVEWGIEQANRDGVSVHRIEDPAEVVPLLLERRPGLLDLLLLIVEGLSDVPVVLGDRLACLLDSVTHLAEYAEMALAH